LERLRFGGSLESCFLKKIATFEYKKRFTEALEVALNFTQSSALQTGYENKIP
jgi:hypothetical protein